MKDLATPERQAAIQGWASLFGPTVAHPAAIFGNLAQPQITAAIKALAGQKQPEAPPDPAAGMTIPESFPPAEQVIPYDPSHEAMAIRAAQRIQR